MKRTRAPWPLIAFGFLTLASSALVSQLGPARGGNLARGAEVTASSREGNFPWSGVVDGNVTHLGLHTALEDKPWVLIRLPELRRISRVLVYNRMDCCTDRSAPLAVELSRDGSKFFRVGTQQTPFEMWELAFAPTEIAFVRVQLLRRSILNLREIEVY